MEQTEFLKYLRDEFSQYHLIPNSDTITKHEKKHYINGLMKASRFFGVSFDELKAIIDSEFTQYIDKASTLKIVEDLDIPTFIRQNQ